MHVLTPCGASTPPGQQYQCIHNLLQLLPNPLTWHRWHSLPHPVQSLRVRRAFPGQLPDPLPCSALLLIPHIHI